MNRNLLLTSVFFVFIMLWIKFLDVIRPILVTDTIFGSFFTNFGVIFFSCILAPMVEELIFRKVPLDFARDLYKKTGLDLGIALSLLSSYIFAQGHNNAPFNELLQGVAGYFLCVLYIRTGYKYWWNVIAHAAWNLGVMFVLPLF